MLADGDPIGADVDIDWTTDCAGGYEGFVVVSNRTTHVFDTDACYI
jgi:hypothetical protein